MNKDTQSWSNSNLTEMEELLQKVQQLEIKNAALREKAERYRLVTLRQDADNTALCNKLAALENQTQWECSCGGTDCEGQKENAALREQIAALGEIACLNLDDATVAKCDAVTGGEKYKDVLRRLFVEQPKELAALRQDKGILDWMNNNIQAIMFKYKPDGFTWDFRKIIGDAMSKEAKP